jgi:hypothetical protein
VGALLKDGLFAS